MWNDFTQKKIHMLEKTHTSESPWYIIRSDDKHKARIEAMKLILRELYIPEFESEADLKADNDVLVSVEEELFR
jgi:polyphosphate kinase 2 (PPK2 family)